MNKIVALYRNTAVLKNSNHINLNDGNLCLMDLDKYRYYSIIKQNDGNKEYQYLSLSNTKTEVSWNYLKKIGRLSFIPEYNFCRYVINNNTNDRLIPVTMELYDSDDGIDVYKIEVK